MLGFGALARKVFGTPNDRKVKAVRPLVAKINALEAEYQALSDDGIKERTAAFKARIAATLDFIGGLAPAAFEGAEQRDMTFMAAGKERTLRGDLYLLHYAMPNFYFHVTTGYDILRHNGVEIGKRDFLGIVPT